jgi:putative inorganic carbon (hco3(-)) transporter
MTVTTAHSGTRSEAALILGGRPGPIPGVLVVALAAVVASVAMGWMIASQPESLQVTVPATAMGMIILLAGLVAAAVALRYPALGLYLLVAFIYLDLSQALVRSYQGVSLLQLMVVPVLIAAWAERQRTAQPVAAFPLAPTAALTAYVLVVLASSTWAGDAALATSAAITLAKALVIYGAVVLLASSVDRIRTASFLMVLSGAFLAGLGVYQTLVGDFSNQFAGLARIKYAHIHTTVFEPRIAGPLGDPNFFAQILVPLVPISLALAWGARDVRLRAAGYGAALLLVAGTVLTYSRGAALALGVVLVLSLLAHGVKARQIASALLLLLLLIPFAPDGFARRLSTIAQVLPGSEAVLKPDSSFGKRRVVTGVAWSMLADRPLLGVGAGNYTTDFHSYVERVGSAAREYEADEANYAHSLYLEIGAETGSLGLLTFGAALLVCFTCLRHARSRFRSTGRDAAATLARGVEIALIGYLISSVFLHGHHIRYLWLLFALAAAMYAVSRMAPEGEKASV